MTAVVNQNISAARPIVVVIGYGNPQRGDDAIGQTVVSHLQARSMPKVEAYAVPQLTQSSQANWQQQTASSLWTLAN